MRLFINLFLPLIIIIVVRPHRCATFVDAVYCYWPSSVVCLSVGLSVTLVSHAKTAEPIEMPFALWVQMSAKHHVLDEVPDPHGNGQFLGERRGFPL